MISGANGERFGVFFKQPSMVSLHTQQYYFGGGYCPYFGLVALIYE